MGYANRAAQTEEWKARKVERQRIRRLTNPDVNGNLKSILGDLDYNKIYKDLFKKQNGLCAICGKPPGSIRLHIDHCHTTGKIRGLLCYSCNTKLGFVEKYLFKIIDYLGGSRC